MTGFRNDIRPEDLEPMSNEQMMFGAMYASMASRLKKKGSNITPQKKKRKKKK